MKRSYSGLTLVLMLASFGCSKSVDTGACSLVLVNPRTGAQAAIGTQVTRARQLAEDANVADAIRVAVREVDSQANPGVARAEVERALASWNAPVVVGSIFSAETREFLRPVLDRGVVILANGSSDPGLRFIAGRKAHDGFFRNWPADDLEGQVMAQYVVSSGRANRLAVLHANDPYPNALSQAFTDEFRRLGGEVVGSPTVYDANTTAFDDLLRRLAGLQFDGFYIVGFPRDLAGIYNAVRRTPELQAKPIFSAVGIESGDFDKLVNKPVRDLFYTAPALDESAKPYFDFAAAYRKRYRDERPDIVAAITYDAIRIASTAVASVGCDATKIREYLYAAKPFEGAAGPTGFDALGDVVSKPVAIKYFEQGQRRVAVTRARGQ
ncbi:MAG: ABC transporter substrate-binding protein [Candidatus Binatia bacterium]